MFLFYVLAALPVLVGIYVWYNNAKVTWLEWLGSSALSFILAGIIHWCAIKAMTDDTETWSGMVQSATHIPQWVDYHPEQRSITTVDSKGNSHTTYYTVWVHETHYPKWYVDTEIGTFNISSEKYAQLINLMGGQRSYPGSRPYYSSGDRNDYTSVNKNNWQEPVNNYVTFENRVKACPSVFSYEKVDKDAPVFEYPKDNSLFASERLLGSAAGINLFEFDKMNARLGPSKLVNVIMCGFNEGSASLGVMQESKWIGGKKNDLVICFSKDLKTQKASWAYVFGWTEKDIVKRNIESILIENKIDTSILPLIEKEIRANYELKDWSKFDYLTIPIPGRFYVYFIIFMVITQVGYYFWAFNNEIEKDTSGDYGAYGNKKKTFGSFVRGKINSFKGKKGSGSINY